MRARLAARLANTEYAIYRSPEETRRTPFGSFVQISDFPTRWDANQMFDVRCKEEQSRTFLTFLDSLYETSGIRFRKLALHHPATAAHLIPTLREAGWDCRRHLMMTLGDFHDSPPDPRFTIRRVDSHSAELNQIYEDNEELRYRRSQDARLGGEILIAEASGVPVGATGWFVVNGIARFRLIETVLQYRRCGVATALVRYVAQRTRSEGIRTLCLHCPEMGPQSLYASLDFKARADLWYCVLLEPEERTVSKLQQLEHGALVR